MESKQQKQQSIFLEVHDELPREGPGNWGSTKRAFQKIPMLASPDVLEIACSPGMGAIDLAKLSPNSHIEAIDLHEIYVEEARRRIKEKNLSAQITVSKQDMSELDFHPESFDLILCEGAAYVIGVEKALQLWQKLLKPEGYLAFTDCVWLKDSPPKELRDFWSSGYADMQSVKHRIMLIDQCGYDVIDHFILPDEAWMDDYYQPMEDRILRLRKRHEGDVIENEAQADLF